MSTPSVAKTLVDYGLTPPHAAEIARLSNVEATADLALNALQPHLSIKALTFTGGLDVAPALGDLVTLPPDMAIHTAHQTLKALQVTGTPATGAAGYILSPLLGGPCWPTCLDTRGTWTRCRHGRQQPATATQEPSTP